MSRVSRVCFAVLTLSLFAWASPVAAQGPVLRRPVKIRATKKPKKNFVLKKDRVTASDRQKIQQANRKMVGVRTSNTRYLSKSQKARMLGVRINEVGAPFTIDAQNPYKAGQGALSVYGAVLNAEQNKVSTYSGDQSSIRIKMLRSVPRQLYLVECKIGASRSKNVQITLYADGHRLISSVPKGSTKVISFPFTASGRNSTIYIDEHSHRVAWALLGCSITPKK